MILLDTDHVTLIQRNSNESARILARIQMVETSDIVAVTVITYEEQTRGWFKLMAKARSMHEQIAAYDRFVSHIEYFSGKTIVRFGETSAVHLQRLRAMKLRMATMDLKIAAIALANDATLWSRNLRDFRKVPALRVEDAAA